MVYGKHSVRAVFLTRPQAVRRLVLSGKPEYHRELVQTARAAGVIPELVPWPEFRQITGLTDEDKHQGVCVFTTARPIHGEHDLDRLAERNLVEAMDQVSDTQYLGGELMGAATLCAVA